MHCNYLLGLSLIFSKDLYLKKFTLTLMITLAITVSFNNISDNVPLGLPVKMENEDLILFVIEKS